MPDESSPSPAVMPVAALGLDGLRALLRPFGLALQRVEPGQAIPHSYWGESEAGLMGNTLYLRDDTPVHSVLHEASHWLCMDPVRRDALRRDAGGSDVEEHAVCYLQCLLAARVPGYSRARCFADMEAWGYTFVLGSAQAFFERDSEDARAFLREQVFPRHPGLESPDAAS